jgi:hypothetical protein
VQDKRETIELQLRDLGDGTVHLKLRQELPRAVAEQVMALLQHSSAGENARRRAISEELPDGEVEQTQ